MPVTLTETTTTTAAIETQLFTVSSTITALTQTDRTTTKQTVVVTQTALQTVTVTRSDAGSSLAPVKAREDTQLAPSIPDYASAKCPSWDRYVAACKCAGVSALTVTAEAPAATTITEQVTSTTTILVDSTVSTTETLVVPVTATTSITHTDAIPVTATTTLTETELVSTTTVVTQTVTETVTPIAPFRAVATQYQNRELYLQANLIGPGYDSWFLWYPFDASRPNQYIWSIDSEGHLQLAYKPAAPNNYQYTPYVRASSGNVMPYLGVNVDARIAAGEQITKIKASVDSATRELRLEAGGRRNLFWCGALLYMSSGNGSDMQGCIQMFPKTVTA